MGSPTRAVLDAVVVGVVVGLLRLPGELPGCREVEGGGVGPASEL